MATTKSRGSKKVTKKIGSALKKPTRPTRSRVAVSAGRATITLSAADTARAEECLRETGKISLGLREGRVTRLTDLVDNDVITD